MEGLQIEQDQTCSHKILPQHCSKCQIQTFILCQKQSFTKLIKVLNILLFETLKNMQKVFVLDFRLAEDTELGYEDDECSDENMCQGLLPPSEELPAELRIVFIGEKEAYYGFICSLLIKYGSLTMIVNGLDFGSEKIWPEINKRWHWEGDLDNCIFKENLQATEYIEIQSPNDDFMQYFSMSNMDQFLSGYCKMLELDIPEVFSRAVKSGFIVKKKTVGKCECPFCVPEDNDPNRDSWFEWSADFLAQEDCSAYWFYFK